MLTYLIAKDHDFFYNDKAAVNHTHSGYASSSHNHDDRYYTESEIEGRFGHMKEVYRGIVASPTNVQLEADSIYIMIARNDISGGAHNGCFYFIITGNTSIGNLYTIQAPQETKIWANLVWSNFTFGMYPNTNYYNVVRIIRI